MKGENCRRIRLEEGNAKSLGLKSNPQKYFAAAVYLFETPSPSLFCQGQGIL
jgi:hypothetical protein